MSRQRPIERLILQEAREMRRWERVVKRATLLRISCTVVVVAVTALATSQNVPYVPGRIGTAQPEVSLKRCAPKNLPGTPQEPINGCKRVRRWDCDGDCAVSNIVINKCQWFGGGCSEALRLHVINCDHVPCIPIEGVGGAGCKCDTSVPPTHGAASLWLNSC